MWNRCTNLLLAAAFLVSVGCGAPGERPTDGRLSVVVGIPPLASLVEQIGGRHVRVDVLVEPGQDPHTFEPTPRQVVALGRAALFFQIDMPFETVLLEKIQEGNGRLKIVATTRGIAKRPIGGHCDGRHSGEQPARADNFDPHVWLAPALAKRLAENIAEALCGADAAHQEEYRKNLAALSARLDAADKKVRRMLAPYRGRAFYVFHSGFGYFADAYGLREETIEVEGQSPTPKQLRALMHSAKAEGVKTIFVQPEFDRRAAEIVAEEIGGHAVPLDGLGRDVVANIEDIGAKIERALRETVRSPLPPGEG
jgi:zinc transport system substrate-binding protein